MLMLVQRKIILFFFLLTRTPLPPQPVANDPLRICLFPADPDEDINDNYIYS